MTESHRQAVTTRKRKSTVAVVRVTDAMISAGLSEMALAADYPLQPSCDLSGFALQCVYIAMERARRS